VCLKRCKDSNFSPFGKAFSEIIVTFAAMKGPKYDMRLIFAILGGKVSEVIVGRLNHNFSSYDVPLTSDEWTILYCLWNEDGLTQRQLCGITMKDKIQMNRLINRLEAKQMVTRNQIPEDHRVNQIRLTERAREMQEKTAFVADKTLKEVLRGLSEEELQICQEGLRIIFNNSHRNKKV